MSVCVRMCAYIYIYIYIYKTKMKITKTLENKCGKMNTDE